MHEYGLVDRLSEQVDTEGYLHAPTRPGLGYDIDWNLVARKRVGEVR
jgi:L-alanine-DL-glutamate epimerase-like enolase superfamily enzyme